MTLLVVLTVVEIVLFVTVLATYLVLLHRKLTAINSNLARITFGIRAVETQTSTIGPSVTSLNKRLTEAAGVLGPLVEKAERLTR
jgi:hypothetical protein